MTDNNKKSQHNEVLLCCGNATTKLGNKVFDYGANIILANLGSVGIKLLALYQSSEIIVSVIMNLYGGVKADTKDKRKILIISDMVSGILCLILSAFLKNNYLGIGLVCVNIFLAILSSFNTPAVKGVVVECVEKERISKFNSILHLSTEIIRIVGPVIGLALINSIGVKGTFIFNGITFILSSLMEFFLYILFSSEKKESKNVFEEIKIGFMYIAHHKNILYVVALSAAVNFFLAGYNLYLPLINIYYGKEMYSWLLIAESIGGIGGALLSAKRPVVSIKGMVLCLCLSGGGLMGIEIASISKERDLLILAFIAMFSMWLCLFNISSMSYIQKTVEREYVSRVFSIIFSVVIMFMPLGSWSFSLLSYLEMHVFTVVGAALVFLPVTFWGKKIIGSLTE